MKSRWRFEKFSAERFEKFSNTTLMECKANTFICPLNLMLSGVALGECGVWGYAPCLV
jgi:hypothetical protein